MLLFNIIKVIQILTHNNIYNSMIIVINLEIYLLILLINFNPLLFTITISFIKNLPQMSYNIRILE
jgi:hypothetical protein